MFIERQSRLYMFNYPRIIEKIVNILKTEYLFLIRRSPHLHCKIILHQKDGSSPLWRKPTFCLLLSQQETFRH